MKAPINTKLMHFMNKDFINWYSPSTILLMAILFIVVYIALGIFTIWGKVDDIHSWLFTDEKDIIFEVTE